MSDVHSEAAEQIARLRVLWPVLNSRPEHTREIVQAIARHAPRLKPSDVADGFSLAIENAPTNGWPPGPHEVLACVLKAAETRRAITAPTRQHYPSGISFAEWWHGLAADEREQHHALAKIMQGRTLQPVAGGDEW
jgi:hypothetical protein